jgi:hypothetical protein
MTTIARWFLKTGLILLAIGAALFGIGNSKLRPSVPGDRTVSIGKRSLRLPIGTAAILVVLLTLYLNTFGRKR